MSEPTRIGILTEWDYCEVLADMPHDEAQRFIERARQDAEKYRAEGEVIQDLRVKLMNLPCPPGESVYRFTAYGSFASWLVGFWLTSRPSAITRLDLKVIMPRVSELDLVEVLKACLEPDARNTVQTFNSRPRQHKTQGGQTGGYGFAIGSPESDTRATGYKKPNEPAQLEVQLSGRPLQRLLSAARVAGTEAAGSVDRAYKATRIERETRSRMYDVLVRKLSSVPSVLRVLGEVTGVSWERSYVPVGDSAVWVGTAVRRGRRIVEQGDFLSEQAE